MTPKTTPTQTVWLTDPHKSIKADALTDILDQLYAAEPSPTALKHAQSRLRSALAKEKTNMVYYDMVPHTSVGPLFAAVSERGLIAVDFSMSERAFVEHVRAKTKAEVIRSKRHAAVALRQIQEYLAGRRTSFDLPIDCTTMSDFQRKVLKAALRVPRGQVLTYGDIARQIGRPKAARAVGQALGHNPVPIVIPCHRVLGSDGSLHGYSGGGGIKTKAWLLQLEGAALSEGLTESN
jgi:methylated-DNA-[protein]-cysteine S-methyltransferase